MNKAAVPCPGPVNFHQVLPAGAATLFHQHPQAGTCRRILSFEHLSKVQGGVVSQCDHRVGRG